MLALRSRPEAGGPVRWGDGACSACVCWPGELGPPHLAESLSYAYLWYSFRRADSQLPLMLASSLVFRIIILKIK